MKKKPYLENMIQVLSDTNNYALRYKDGDAWDNKKKKTWRLHAPRGKVLNRFFNMEKREKVKIQLCEREREDFLYHI